jgi:uncharacterized membrane protein
MRFVAGVLTGAGGLWSFVYAHRHEPAPGADPMAVHLLSPAAYQCLRYGGLLLIVVSVLLMLWEFVRVARSGD